MILEVDSFRLHVDSMIEKGQKKQLRMWIDNGLLIYVNHETLTEIWDEEYEDIYNEM